MTAGSGGDEAGSRTRRAVRPGRRPGGALPDPRVLPPSPVTRFAPAPTGPPPPRPPRERALRLGPRPRDGRPRPPADRGPRPPAVPAGVRGGAPRRPRAAGRRARRAVDRRLRRAARRRTARRTTGVSTRRRSSGCASGRPRVRVRLRAVDVRARTRRERGRPWRGIGCPGRCRIAAAPRGRRRRACGSRSARARSAGTTCSRGRWPTSRRATGDLARPRPDRQLDVRAVRRRRRPAPRRRPRRPRPRPPRRDARQLRLAPAPRPRDAAAVPPPPAHPPRLGPEAVEGRRATRRSGRCSTRGGRRAELFGLAARLAGLRETDAPDRPRRPRVRCSPPDDGVRVTAGRAVASLDTWRTMRRTRGQGRAMRETQVMPGVVEVRILRSNIHAVLEDRVTLIDAGLPGSRPGIGAALAAHRPFARRRRAGRLHARPPGPRGRRRGTRRGRREVFMHPADAALLPTSTSATSSAGRARGRLFAALTRRPWRRARSLDVATCSRSWAAWRSSIPPATRRAASACGRHATASCSRATCSSAGSAGSSAPARSSATTCAPPDGACNAWPTWTSTPSSSATTRRCARAGEMPSRGWPGRRSRA